jgi:hypothetical protein
VLLLSVKLAAGYSLLAGVVSALGAMLFSVQFWEALLTAAIIGMIAAAGAVLGAVLAARIAAKALEDVHAKVDDVKRHLDDQAAAAENGNG